MSLVSHIPVYDVECGNHSASFSLSSTGVCVCVCVCVCAAEADSMLTKEGAMLALPGPALSVDLIDAERKKSRS